MRHHLLGTHLHGVATDITCPRGLMNPTKRQGPPTIPPVDQARRRLLGGAGKATVAAAATTLVLSAGLKTNSAHALALYEPVPCLCD